MIVRREEDYKKLLCPFMTRHQQNVYCWGSNCAAHVPMQEVVAASADKPPPGLGWVKVDNSGDPTASIYWKRDAMYCGVGVTHG